MRKWINKAGVNWDHYPPHIKLSMLHWGLIVRIYKYSFEIANKPINIIEKLPIRESNTTKKDPNTNIISKCIFVPLRKVGFRLLSKKYYLSVYFITLTTLTKPYIKASTTATKKTDKYTPEILFKYTFEKGNIRSIIEYASLCVSFLGSEYSVFISFFSCSFLF